MKRTIPILILLTLFLTNSGLCQDNKAKLVRTLSNGSYIKKLASVITQELMDFELSDEAWTMILSDSDHINSVSNYSGTLATVANNLGIADIEGVHNSTGRDHNNPLVRKKIESVKGKVKFTLSIPSTDPQALKKVGEKLNSIVAVFTNDYYFLPRSGTAFVTIHFDEGLEQEKVEVSDDGSTYKVSVPVYGSFSQSRTQKALQQGK